LELIQGTIIAGRFRLESHLGKGGMGAVWLAQNLSLDAPCAIKFLHASAAESPMLRARFEREAKAAAQLRSPNVVQILEHGVWEGLPYIAMELLEGEDLAQRLARVGRLSPHELVTIFTQVARALSRAHAAGLIHRDLKPANIFLVRDDDREIVKILDFGVAKQLQTEVDGSNTKTGAMMGTPYYMSPEQARGTKEVDHRADLWAMGVIAYRCLLGRLPFEAPALGELLMLIMAEPLPVPSEIDATIPPGFDGWWAKAMARLPEQRFASAKEMAESLATALGVSLDPLADRVSLPGPAAVQTSPGAVSGAGVPAPLPAPGTTSSGWGIRKTLALLLFIALLGLGLFVVLRKGSDEPKGANAAAPSGAALAGTAAPAGPASSLDAKAKESVEAKLEVPRLPPPAAYTPKDNTLDIELSEYAGYAGLIAANGGLSPNEDSVFFKKHGVKVKIRLSEAESWGDVASGALAAAATTVDVLAVYGQSLGAVTPVQIGYSRGADGIVVRSEIKRVNQLQGRILVASKLNEADFFIRFLAREAMLEINTLADLKAPADPTKLNLIYAGDAKQTGEVFLREVQGDGSLLAGCVTWAPFTTEVVKESGGKAHLLVSNKNLLIIADVLIVNKGLAEQSPKMVAALVDGLLEGNKMVREDPGAHADTIAKAFGWKREDVPQELAKVHLSNLPENLAFFSGAIEGAGGFGGIYQYAVMAYGPELIKNPASEEKLIDLQHLKALERSGAYKDQKIAIAPVPSGGDQAPLTAPPALAPGADPLLSKDIRFYFEANSSKLDLSGKDAQSNEANLFAIRKLLQVSPGSTVLIRGHVDGSMNETFRKQGGEAFAQAQALAAVKLSEERANEIRNLLVRKHGIDTRRIYVYGVGGNEPVSKTDPELNRRVEVQWFTLE
jgi:NitT/TauT family transport system substrate-binding protein